MYHLIWIIGYMSLGVKYLYSALDIYTTLKIFANMKIKVKYYNLQSRTIIPLNQCLTIMYYQ